MKLWLDDIRPMPIGYDIHCKTAQEAIAQLETGKITHISFDHDLGLDLARNGYYVACFAEAEAYAGRLPKLTWSVHSANPIGKARIIQAMQSADKFWAKVDING